MRTMPIQRPFPMGVLVAILLALPHMAPADAMPPHQRRRQLLDAFHQEGLKAMPVLVDALEDEALFVRRSAAHLLVRLGRPAYSGLGLALENDDSEVRRIAAEGMVEGLLRADEEEADEVLAGIVQLYPALTPNTRGSMVRFVSELAPGNRRAQALRETLFLRWTGKEDGDWTNPENWSLGVPPTGHDEANVVVLAAKDPGTLDIVVPAGGDAPQTLRFHGETTDSVTIAGAGDWNIPNMSVIEVEAGSGAHMIALDGSLRHTTPRATNHVRNFSANPLTLNTRFATRATTRFGGSGDIVLGAGLTVSSTVVLEETMTGRLILPEGRGTNSNHSYTVNGGTWVIDGRVTVRASSFRVNEATVAGNGRIGAREASAGPGNHRPFRIHFNRGSVLRPGRPGQVGELTFENRDLNLNEGSTLRLDLISPERHDSLAFALTAIEVDAHRVVPSVNLEEAGAGVALELNLKPGFSAEVGDVFVILSGYKAVNGTFAGLPNGARLEVGEFAFRIEYEDQRTTLTVVPAAN